ncbi:MAG: hypothetical protein PW788_02720 [Micavibrio sp.]|nr:hypothetical protein [Micavibrio sp.]
MAFIRRNGENSITWVLESADDALPARIAEFVKIFDYYAQRKESITDNFTMQLLALQAHTLLEVAKKQEADLKRLKQLEADMAALKKEMLEMKGPQTLDKPKLPRPKAPKNP